MCFHVVNKQTKNLGLVFTWGLGSPFVSPGEVGPPSGSSASQHQHCRADGDKHVLMTPPFSFLHSRIPSASQIIRQTTSSCLRTHVEKFSCGSLVDGGCSASSPSKSGGTCPRGTPALGRRQPGKDRMPPL